MHSARTGNNVEQWVAIHPTLILGCSLKNEFMLQKMKYINKTRKELEVAI